MDRAAAERGQERIVENIRRGSFSDRIDRPVRAGRTECPMTASISSSDIHYIPDRQTGGRANSWR
jgi:hypothetical protein